METIYQDVRYGWRILGKSPGFALVVVLMLALGIGANTAVFTVLSAALLRPLPFEKPEELVQVWETRTSGAFQQMEASYPDFVDLRNSHVFAQLGGYSRTTMTLSQPSGAVQVTVAIASTGFFETLGVRPLLGRSFVPSEETEQKTASLLLSYGGWQRRFGGDPAVVGKTLTLDGVPSTIIGVLPRDFQFGPTNSADFWQSLQVSGWRLRRNAHWLYPIGRLRSGASLQQAQSALLSVTHRLESQYPDSNAGVAMRLVSLREELLGSMKLVVIVLMATVGFVLLITWVRTFYQQLVERVAVLPGVESAGLMSGGPSEMLTFSILGHAPPPPDGRPRAVRCVVNASLFRTLKIPLRSGRYLDEHDTQTAPWGVVINETVARRYFPNEDPIGQQLMLRYDPYAVEEPQPRRIVGVVGDVKHFGLGQPAPPFVYLSYPQQPAVFPGGAVVPFLDQMLMVRISAGTVSHQTDLASAVKKVVGDLDPDQPVTDIRTMDQALEESIGDSRFYMSLFGVFAGIAVLLAVVGIYGVLSYFVSERTHEIGIRVALGAFPSDVITLVGKLGLKLTLIGVAIGIGLAIGLTRLIAQFLVGVKPTDAVTYAIVAAGLVGVSLLACYVPARRAANVDPMVALRYE